MRRSVVRHAAPLLALFAIPVGAQALLPPPTPAIAEVRRHFTEEGLNALIFHSIASIFDTVPVKAGGPVLEVKRAEVVPTFGYEYKGARHSFEDVFERTYTNALLIIKNDRIVFERYRNYTDPDTRFLSMSMAKSITSILIGAAIADGKIRSVDDQIVAYVPALRGTAYDGVSIRNALLMKSGVDGTDDYDWNKDADAKQEYERGIVMNQRRSLDDARALKRADAPGKTFRYLTTNTEVLGRVLEGATGQPLATYTSERLWKPLGAQGDARWMVSADSLPRNGMGFNATMQDFARIGLLMLHDGRINGHQIIPASWVRESTVPTGPEPANSMETLGYQYQWWTFPSSNAYTAIGLQGQYIYVDPDTKTVVVKLSYFPPNKDEYYKETEEFLKAVSAWPGR
jgi:CubicO group peptidase (beta-lactamase class C family)